MKPVSSLYFLFLLFSLSIRSETLVPVVLTKHFGARDGLGTKTIYSIVQDHDGFMWFATDAGAYRYDGSEFRHYTVANGLSDNEIFRAILDKKGRVWFLTYNGYLSFYYKGIIYNQSK